MIEYIQSVLLIVSAILIIISAIGLISLGKNTKNNPADKGKAQHKQVHLVAVCHLLGFIDALQGGFTLVLCQNVGGHGIGIAFDNAGDHKQQRPQECKESNKECYLKRCPEIIKAAKSVSDLWLATFCQAQINADNAQCKGRSNDNG